MAIRTARRTLSLEQSYYVRLAEQSLMLIFSCRFGSTTGFLFWNHITHKFILNTGQIAGVCFTHVALSVLSTIYSQRILRELFYHLSDFSNSLLALFADLFSAVTVLIGTPVVTWVILRRNPQKAF
ncbi:MAG: hypothetical protein V7L31_06840 [Nostoc sp.]|uniref:hypothetical protein n=1 Tax=Nostoc sp. TaxID=1180 RepID=UPI002FF356DE